MGLDYDDYPRRRHRRVSGGSSVVTVWLLGFLGIGALFVLGCCGGLLLLGKRAEQANTESAKDFTRDFQALSKWCEQAVGEVRQSTQANPIRGKELENAKLDYLRKELVGKTVHWKVRVNTIDPSGSVRVASFHRVLREQFDNQGRMTWHEYMLSVRLQDRQEFRGEDAAFDPVFIVKDVPAEKLRTLSVGEFAPLTGTVEIVDGFITMRLRGAKIE